MNAPSDLPAQAEISVPRVNPGTARRGLWIAVLLAAGASAGLYAWWLDTRPVATAYVTATAETGPVTRAVTATGTVNPVLTVLVGSYVSGVIQELFCDYNTRVKRGQICARIDPRPYQSQVDQRRANLATARAQLAKDEANLRYARLASERDAKLLDRGIVSQEAADASRSAHDQAQAQIALDQATIEQRSAELEAAEVNLGYTDIASPVDGTVVSRNVTMGQTVAASFQTPTLFLIATDLTRMQVDTNVSESDIGGPRIGSKASFTVEAYPGRTFPAVVSQVRQSPQTVQNVVTYDVVATVPNPELLLKPGMTATVRIVTDSREAVLRVPNQALRYVPRSAAQKSAAPGQARKAERRSNAGRAGRVWVLDGASPRRVDVSTGLEDENWTEITGGALKPGDTVIVSERNGASAPRRSVPLMKF